MNAWERKYLDKRPELRKMASAFEADKKKFIKE